MFAILSGIPAYTCSIDFIRRVHHFMCECDVSDIHNATEQGESTTITNYIGIERQFISYVR